MAAPSSVSDTGQSSIVPPWSDYAKNMQPSQRAIDMVKAFEGLRLTAYGDVTGVQTIGYGHTHNVRPGQQITASLAEEYLRQDLAGVERTIEQTVLVQLTQGMYDALTDWIFNLGSGNWQRSGALLHLNRAEYDTCIGIMCLYNQAGGRPIPGLIRRRMAERAVWLSPDTEKAAKP